MREEETLNTDYEFDDGERLGIIFKSYWDMERSVLRLPWASDLLLTQWLSIYDYNTIQAPITPKSPTDQINSGKWHSSKE